MFSPSPCGPLKTDRTSRGICGFVIVPGKGNAESLVSAAHGAARVMSRSLAEKSLTWSDLKPRLAADGVALLSAGIDEAPGVYKNTHEVMGHQEDLVETVARFDSNVVKMAPSGAPPRPRSTASPPTTPGARMIHIVSPPPRDEGDLAVFAVLARHRRGLRATSSVPRWSSQAGTYRGAAPAVAIAHLRPRASTATMGRSLLCVRAARGVEALRRAER